MKWATLVKEGKLALASQSASTWKIGDLALLVEPVTSVGTTTGANERLQKWADAIGWGRSLHSLLQYRFVSNAWPPEHRSQASYSTHVALTSLPNRFDVIRDDMKVNEARELVGWTKPKGVYGVRPERIIHSLRDPEVLSVVLADPDIRDAIREALDSAAPETTPAIRRSRLFGWRAAVAT